MADAAEFQDRLLSLGLARVSEAAALASAALIGRGDEKAADQAAVNAMRDQLNLLDIAGVVVIGEGERDEAPMLFIGEEVGSGKGPAVDIALDPLEGTTLTAKDMPNALTVIAMAPRGTLLRGGDVLVAEDGSLIRVIAAPQAVLRITPCAVHGSPFDLTRAAYHLGNRHVPIELTPEHLQIEPDHVLADMLRAMHLTVVELQAPFEPEGGAYAAHGHGHHQAHHDHGHGHDHAHHP